MLVLITESKKLFLLRSYVVLQCCNLFNRPKNIKNRPKTDQFFLKKMTKQQTIYISGMSKPCVPFRQLRHLNIFPLLQQHTYHNMQREFWIVHVWNGYKCTIIIRHGTREFWYLRVWDDYICPIIIHHGWRDFWNLHVWNGYKCAIIILHGWREFWNLHVWNGYKCTITIHHA